MGLPFILPAASPLKLYKGSYFRKTFTHKTRDENSVETPVDITGYTFRCMIRESYKSDTAVLTLTTANGGFEMVDADAGQFRMVITDTQTASFVFSLGQKKKSDIPYYDYVFDIEAIPPSNEPIQFLKGVLRVYAESTR